MIRYVSSRCISEDKKLMSNEFHNTVPVVRFFFQPFKNDRDQ